MNTACLVSGVVACRRLRPCLVRGAVHCLLINYIFSKPCHFTLSFVSLRKVHSRPRAVCTALRDGSECILLSTPNQELFWEQKHGRERN